jgi:hypothetical protein
MVMGMIMRNDDIRCENNRKKEDKTSKREIDELGARQIGDVSKRVKEHSR